MSRDSDDVELFTKLDNLIAVIITGKNIIIGSYTYTNAGGTQSIQEVSNILKIRVKGIIVDCTNLTQNGTLGFWAKVDGINYRQLKTASFTVASDDSIMLNIDLDCNYDFKFTWTEGGDEGADRALPFQLSYEINN